MPYPYTGYYANPYATPQTPIVPQMPYAQANNQPVMNNGVQPQMAAPQAAQQPISANKIYVTSLQDALSRFSSPNTTISYTTQDEKYEIEVFTDTQGKKTYQVFERKPYTPSEEKTPAEQPAANYATKDDIAGIEKMFNEKLADFSKEVAEARESIKGIRMPDMNDYVTLAEADDLRAELTRSFKDEINGLKSRMGQQGGKNNA